MSAERIEEEASRWLAARDSAGGIIPNAAEFDRWLGADIRHRVAYLRLEASWRRAERLRDLKPLDRDINPELLKEKRRIWPALAASLALAVLAAGAWFQRESGWQRYETRVGGFSRIVLSEGSVIDLNTNSEVRVRIRERSREVELLRGEGRFQVATDAARPFVVTAAGAAVRAVGTEFSVRLRDSSQVDVLVAEGRVAIDAMRVPPTPPVNAGEAAVVLPDRMSVRRVEPQLLERRLAWTFGRIELRGETLGEAVAEFNRYNQRPLRVADAMLASLRVTGSFTATDPESFAAALGSAFRLRVEPASDAIVLHSR